MNEQTKQALMILAQAAEVAQSKGAFSLADAGVISQAVAYVAEVTKEEAQTEDAPMEVVEEKEEPKKK